MFKQKSKWIFVFGIIALLKGAECLNVEEWGDWTSCPKTCDGGLSVRIRGCLIKDCGMEEVFQTQPCATQKCQQKIDSLGDWGSWSECSGKCGIKATRTRAWTCGTDAKSCKIGTVQTENCWKECSVCQDMISSEACEVMGKTLFMCQSSSSYDTMLNNCAKTCDFCDENCSCVTGWGPWSQCSISCGGGFRVKNRDCGEHALECGLSVNQTEICNTEKCVEWSPCSKSCGVGTQETLCQDDSGDCAKLYKECNTNNCVQQSCSAGTDVYRYESNSDCCDPVNASTTCGRSDLGSQIVGGVEAIGNSWPWMLLFKLGYPRGNRFSYCGGVLLTDRWAVTAAHCVFVFNENHTLVIGGIKKFTNPGQRVYAKRIIRHPGFDMPRNDIALVELRRPFILKTKDTPKRKMSPLCMPLQEETPLDANCYVAGWGATDITRISVSRTLNQAKIKNLNLNICKSAYKSDYYGRKFSDSMLCAGRLTGGVDTCQGDSGGPMMCQRCSSCSWYLAGITSFGSLRCGSAGMPGVYTKVLDYENWIMSYIDTPTENKAYKDTC